MQDFFIITVVVIFINCKTDLILVGHHQTCLKLAEYNIPSVLFPVASHEVAFESRRFLYMTRPYVPYL